MEPNLGTQDMTRQNKSDRCQEVFPFFLHIYYGTENNFGTENKRTVCLGKKFWNYKKKV